MKGNIDRIIKKNLKKQNYNQRVAKIRNFLNIGQDNTFVYQKRDTSVCVCQLLQSAERARPLLKTDELFIVYSVRHFFFSLLHLFL